MSVSPPSQGGFRWVPLMAYKTASPDWYELLKGFARENRKNPTIAEQVLWEHIRDKALGKKFLRQHIIGDYIADFVSPEHHLIIEVDGAYHAERQQLEKDEDRTGKLNKLGFWVVRFTNEEILNDIETTIKTIKAYIGYE